MAKAAYWTATDVEARKRGEQTGLDTLIGKQCDTLFLGLVAQFKEVSQTSLLSET